MHIFISVLENFNYNSQGMLGLNWQSYVGPLFELGLGMKNFL